MAASACQLAKRAFLTLLIVVAKLYGLSAGVNRNSSDQDIEKSFRMVSKRAHPDKGGATDKYQDLISAREKWQAYAAREK